MFYLTIAGANVPSALLADALFALQDVLSGLCAAIGMPAWLHGALVLGVYRTLAWVVSVMLPPMAIFFPLFTLLEDLGYLPRVAFNLDNRFRRCAACGKQALTMWVVDKRMRMDMEIPHEWAVGRQRDLWRLLSMKSTKHPVSLSRETLSFANAKGIVELLPWPITDCRET